MNFLKDTIYNIHKNDKIFRNKSKRYARSL